MLECICRLDCANLHLCDSWEDLMKVNIRETLDFQHRNVTARKDLYIRE